MVISPVLTSPWIPTPIFDSKCEFKEKDEQSDNGIVQCVSKMVLFLTSILAGLAWKDVLESNFLTINIVIREGISPSQDAIIPWSLNFDKARHAVVFKDDNKSKHLIVKPSRWYFLTIWFNAI